MTVQELLLGALYLGAGVIGWFLKDALDSSKATKDSLADFKTEVAKEYVPRMDLKELQAEVGRRFDRLEDKIDAFIKEHRSALS
jgi:hypothetical protein